MLDVNTDRLSRTVDLLIEANHILSASFDVAVTLPALAQLCVTQLADYCIIQLRPYDGVAVPTAFAASEHVDIKQFGDPDKALLESLAEHGLHSMVVCPMTLGSQTFGAITFASTAADAFDEVAHKILNLVALRVAVAINTITSFTREHRVADRLQRALLPDSFPHVENLSFGGAYRPASSEAEVGGDWYDAFALPDGRIAISIGDVAGHGLEAAVIMGEVRQALRAAAIGSDRPSAVLEAVNGVINLRESVGMVTAIFAFYDPHSSVLRYAVAGHPPPIIATPDGFAQVLPGGGLPLGASNTVQARDWTFTVPPGAQIVLYTDGLIEYGHDLEAGQETLLEAVSSELCGNPGPNPAEAIQQRIFAEEPNKDDSATLTLTRSKQTDTNVTLVFSAIPLVSALVRSTLRQLGTVLNFTSDQTFAVLVAVGEAIANAVEHAYGDREPGLVEVKTHMKDGRFMVQIDDYGRWRPTQKKDERGRGIPLMHALVDGVQIKSTQTNTCITLSIDLDRTSESAESA
ncbi:MAG: SpoIIE family protein phosphatase [Candidatus Eremiobacteraeota bacterium]|nr:SpoIIE family protein phosphatase [Candidatus Eremiobacteraeota bacterium]